MIAGDTPLYVNMDTQYTCPEEVETGSFVFVLRT